MRLRDITNAVKWFVQRGRRGYADCDVWDFDAYLARVIIGGLKALKDKGHSHPGELCECTSDDCGQKRWESLLQDMIAGFDAHLQLLETGNLRVEERLKPIRQRGMELFCEWFPGLWD